MDPFGVLGVTIGFIAIAFNLILFYFIKKHPEWFKDLPYGVKLDVITL